MPFARLYSQRLGYALHALCYMARKPVGTLTTGPELGAWMQSFWPTASETYLTNVIQRMVRGGLLRSHRGKTGGYSLPQEPSKITLRDIMCELEGPQVSPPDVPSTGTCRAQTDCGIARQLQQVEEDYLHLLAEVNLEDFVSDLDAEGSAGEPAEVGPHVPVAAG